MYLQQTDFQTFLKHLNRLPKWKRKYISEKPKADHYFLASENMIRTTPLGGVALREDKNNIIYIMSLFSYKEGSGAKIMNSIIDQLGKSHTLMLDCYGEKLKDYYEKFLFTRIYRESGMNMDDFNIMVRPRRDFE